MHQNFLSLIGIISSREDIHRLSTWLTGLSGIMESNFSDYEFVLVNNHCDISAIENCIKPLPDSLKQHIYLLNLSTKVDRNNATLAGYDRANGDYAILFDFDFAHKPELALQLFEKADGKLDIVYLRAPSRQISFLSRFLYAIFYAIIRRYSNLRIDALAHNTRIISRRALNSLLRLRENSQYLKAIYALVGYDSGFIEVSEPVHPEEGVTFNQQFRTSLLAITSFTSFLRAVLLWIFLFSCLVATVAIYNAFKVKLTNIDIFGEYHETLSGWAFMVVLMSGFFAITCLNLYIMSVYMSHIYAEIKNRPLYIIESVKRF